jgi:DDE_Tnp_1-associated
MDTAAVPASLWEAFASLPDPRDLRGRRHPLPALRSLTAVALLAGMRGLEAIAQVARDHGLARALRAELFF